MNTFAAVVRGAPDSIASLRRRIRVCGPRTVQAATTRAGDQWRVVRRYVNLAVHATPFSIQAVLPLIGDFLDSSAKAPPHMGTLLTLLTIPLRGPDNSFFYICMENRVETLKELKESQHLIAVCLHCFRDILDSDQERRLIALSEYRITFLNRRQDGWQPWISWF